MTPTEMDEKRNIILRSDNSFVSASRALLGLFLLGVGVVTFFVPDFKVAFLGQLSEANIPLQGLVQWVIPTIEGVVGAMMLGGVMMRVASLVSMLLMALLLYLHLVVDDPIFFPLQFGLPLMPIIALVLSAFLYFVERYDED